MGRPIDRRWCGDGRRSRRDEGNALILVVIMLAMLTPLVVVMLQLATSRSVAETHTSAQVLRTYAAEAGLARARFMVGRHTDRGADEHWLRDRAGSDPDAVTPVTWEDGLSYFVHPGGIRGSAQVRVFVVNLTPLANPFSSWYLVVSRGEAPDPDGTVRSVTLAQTMRTTSSFAKYARFVSKEDLSVGSGASYHGEVHSNGSISAPHSTVTFHENVSAHGSISSQPTFLKDKRPNVPKITMPSEAELEALTEDAPGGAVVFDPKDTTFKDQFEAATGHRPGDTNQTEVHVTWKGTQMDIDVKVKFGSTWRTWSRTDVPIPHNGTFFVRGDFYNKGNFASRLTVAATDQIYVTDPVRYVNGAGEGQYTLYKNGSPAGFDAAKNEWTDTADWRGASFDYRETDGWTAPELGGIPYNPSLGLVAKNDFVIEGANISNNAEFHAAFFSSDGTVTTTGSGKKNLYMLGAMITTGTMPLSGVWSYRNYIYDTGFLENPPPAFPTVDEPTFKNWHELATEANGDGTYRLERTDVKTAFGL